MAEQNFKPFSGKLDNPSDDGSWNQHAGLNPFDGELDGTPSSGTTASDLAKSVKVGVQRLPGMVAGLADLPFALATGARPFTAAADALGEATGFQPGKWADETQFSAAHEQSKKAVDAAWQDGSAADIAKAYIANPGYTANQVAESLPSMFAGGLAGRALMGVGRVAAPAARAGGMGPGIPGLAERALGKWAAPVAGGVGEGAVTAGQQMAQYQGEDQQQNALASLGAGVGTGLIGIGAGRVANALGLETAETAIAKVGTGVAKAADEVPLSLKRRVLGGMVSEALLQELPQSAQEQMWSNWAQGKPLMEGVARAGTEGAIAGGVMGVGANLRGARAQQQTDTQAEQQTDTQPMQRPSEAMGIDPSAGPLSKGAAMAVDSGTYMPPADLMQQAAPEEDPIVLQNADFDMNPEAYPVATFLAQNIRSPKAMAEGLRRWGQLALQQARVAEENKYQGNLLGDPTPTLSRQEILARIGDAYNPTEQAVAGRAQPQEQQAQQEGMAAISGEPSAPVAQVGAAAQESRPRNWRTSMLGAVPVAKALGIEHKGKRLAQVVAEIDARDSERNKPPAQAQQAQAATESVASDTLELTAPTASDIEAQQTQQQQAVNEVSAAQPGAVEADGVERSKLLASLDQVGATREMVLDARLKDAQYSLAQITATTGILPADRASRLSAINQEIADLTNVRSQARELDERDRRESNTRFMLRGARQELDAAVRAGAVTPEAARAIASNAQNTGNAADAAEAVFTAVDSAVAAAGPGKNSKPKQPQSRDQQAQAATKQQSAPQPAQGPVRIGRDQTPLNEGGKPFKTRKSAGDAKKLQPMMRVVTVPGGYALAEKTPAQLAAEERASRRLRNPNTSAPGEPIPAHAFIAAAGGLNRAAAADMGVDGNPRIGNRTLFAGQGRGLSLDQATQMLIQDGYMSEGASINDALALVKTSLTRPQYNADGIERIAEAEVQAQFEDYLAAQEEAAAEGEVDPFGMADEFTAEELDEVGYTDADPALQAEVAALITQAEAIGIDTYAILEDIARTYANATQDQYNAAARDALAQAIARGNQDGGSTAAQAAPAAESAADQGLDQPEALELASQTPAEAAAQQEAQEQAAKAEAARQRAADAQAARDEERKRIAQASVAAADTFELGGDAMQNITGQGSLLDASTQTAQYSKPKQPLARTQKAQAAIDSGADTQGQDVMFSRTSDTDTQAQRQFKETERAYGGREAYDRAKKDGKTKLTYGQWVQVRTPNFKAWFGDWEAVRAQERLDAMEPVQVRVPDAWRGLGHAELRQKMAEELDRMVREKVEINHPELGMIRVGRAGAKKSQSTSRDPAKVLVAADLENVLPAAFHARSDAPDTKEQGVHGYSTLLARVDVDGSELIASFSVRQQQDGAWYYNTVTLEDGQNKTPVASPRDTPIAGEHATSANTGVSKEKAQDSYGSPGALSRPLGETPIAGLSDFIRRPLARVNPEAVSKVVDSATGEPLVVYHGTGKDFTEFQEGKRQSQYGGGLYFGRDPKVASSFASPLRGPAPNVMPVYLSLQNPFIETGDYTKTPKVPKLKEQGYDGIIALDGQIVAFYPGQVKSATGNNGNFDPANSDIRFSFDFEAMRAAVLGSGEGLMSPEQARAILALRRPARATKESVHAALRQLVGGLGLLPNRLGRAVVATAAEIKRDWEPLIGPTGMESSDAGEAQGFYDPKSRTVFLIADHINAGDELGVVAHELMHKHGQAVLGEEGWNQLHGAIEGWANAPDGSMEQRVYEEAMDRVKASRPYRANLARYSSQELFPYAVQVALEMGVKPNLLAKQGTVERWLGQVRAALRTVWDKITRKPEQFKSQDLVNLAFGIAQRENPAHAGKLDGMTGQRGGDSGESPMFSRAAPTPKPGAAGWNAPSASQWDDMVYKLQDKHIDTKRALETIRATGKAIADDKDVYLQEELYHGRVAKRAEDFVNNELQPLMTYMSSVGLKMQDVQDYLHARHAKEANAVIAKRNPKLPDGGSGMTNAEADAVLASFNGIRRTQLARAAAQVDAIVAGTRQTFVDYGLESQDTVDGWAKTFAHYVPLMREQDGDGMAGLGTGQGFSIKGREVKGRTGSTRKVVDILANIALQRERAIVRGEKNRVATALVGLAKDNPSALWQVDVVPTRQTLDKKTGMVTTQHDPLYKQRDNVVVAKIPVLDEKTGKVVVKEHAVVFNESDARAMRMATALKNLDAPQMEGLLGATAQVTRYLAAINTQYNPIFGVTNLARDVLGAALNLASTPLAGKQLQVLGQTLSALAGIYSDERSRTKGKGGTASPWAKLWEEFQSVGGQTGYRDQYRTSADRGQALAQALDPSAWTETKWGQFFTVGGRLKVPMEMARKAMAPVFAWLDDYNTAMENGVRLAAYKTALDADMSKERAASLAKNLTTNFNRKGQSATQVGALYAFFNASVQGTARIGQTLFDMEPGQPKTLRLSSLGKKIVAGGVLLGSMQAVLLAAAGFDDEEPADFVRERNLVIPNPLGEKGYVTIPMPLGFHVLPNLGRIPTEFVLGGFKNPAEHVIRLMGLFADTFNPIGNAGLSMQSLAPTVLDPIAALAENKDFSGRKIAKESFDQVTPGHALARDTATAPAKWLAEAINWLSGGTAHTRGAFSPTPDQIDYLIGQATGGVGRELSKLQQSVVGAAQGDDVPWHKVPLMGRFYGDAGSDSAKQSAYYRHLETVQRHAAEVKGLRLEKKPGEAQAYLQKHPEARWHLAANAAQRNIRELQKQRRELEQQGAPRVQVRALEQRIVARMERFSALVRG